MNTHQKPLFVHPNLQDKKGAIFDNIWSRTYGNPGKNQAISLRNLEIGQSPVGHKLLLVRGKTL